MTDQGDANTAAVAVAYGGTTFAIGRADARSGDAKPDRSTTVLALMQLLAGVTREPVRGEVEGIAAAVRESGAKAYLASL